MRISELQQSLSDKTPIQKFYGGKNIFITGGSGFTGKVLIERLLRNFDDIGNIYILIRAKKNKNIYQRFEEMLNCKIYANTAKYQLAKLVPICGEVDAVDLGISEDDRRTLIENVHMVFHCAATVRFDDSLQVSIATNSCGTYYMIELCKQIKQLQSFVHVSTAYSYYHDKLTEEKFYDTGLNVNEMMKLANCPNPDLVDILSHKLIGKFVNSYSFTKCCAERLVLEHGKGLPAAVFRPAIIYSASAMYEYPGFVDNMFGSTGQYMTLTSGLNRVFPVDPMLKINMVPVDFCANIIIVTGWDVAQNKCEIPPIYNFLPDGKANIALHTAMRNFLDASVDTPMPFTFWWPEITFTKNKLYFLFLFLGQFSLALLLDAYMILTSKRPVFVAQQAKTIRSLQMITLFMNNEQDFVMNNMSRLRSRMSPEDRKLFYTDMSNINWSVESISTLLGFRKYMLNISDTDINRMLVRNKRLKKMYYAFNSAMILLGIYLFWKILIAILIRYKL